MKISLIFNQTSSKFFSLIDKKHRIFTIIISTIIGTLFCIFIDIVLPETIRQNATSINMLATEQIIELGPNYIYECGRHAEMIEKYTKHLEQGYCAALFRILYPEYSPKKALASSLSDLEKAAEGTSEEIAQQAIFQAGLASHNLSKLYERFPSSPIKWSESEIVSDQLLYDLDYSLAESHEMAIKLESNPSLETAIAACQADRKTILLLFLVRLGYDDNEKIEAFKRDVEEAYHCTMQLADKEKDQNIKEFLYDVSQSKNRRIHILDAILDNDMERACNILRESIEKIYEEKHEGIVVLLKEYESKH